MKKKAPKLSKKALSVLGQGENDRVSKRSESTEDFMEDGAIEEESGDRWLGSDLAKALRFYQKAYVSYKTAVSIPTSDKALLLDAYYNAARLLFHVFIQYGKTDGVNVHRLTNVGEVLTGDSNSVVQNIFSIVEVHESALQVDLTNPPLDLQFNAALVYTEAIEEAETLSEDLVYKAMALFQEVLRRQVSEFQDFLKFMLEPETPQTQGSDVPSEDQKYSSSKTIQPPDILDTVVSAYGLVQTILESVTSSAGSLEEAVSLVGPFVQTMEEVATEIVSKYSEQNNEQSDIVASIESDQLNEYFISKATCQALSTDSIEQIAASFDGDLPDVPERYMSAADAIDTILDRHDAHSNPQAIDAETYWQALTKMNVYFKKAQELLSARNQEIKTKNLTNTELGLGALIAQICKVYIARSDIDLQRSQLSLEVAQKSSSVLLNNAKAFLKSSMNMSKSSGGLREKAVEKAQRDRRRYEAVSRLCVLEGKLDTDELNRIMGEGMWEEDIATYKEFWYFQKFFQ
ncbi:uncharacterized protein CXQ87_004238 [Candidozyma duobushaemuli]|uniref:BRO1 domain-containing protein n=2 Tax=Candidozyma TaxID=3303203 RepID=A0ABX8IC61_9ASCO|nr:uncharacterized protein CXQ87_004238 [[Candida] duobushaemulonis]PVH16362.1 hypothetical protein CXQ87_004238 [[Candida] duobushaemulonis]QWU88978.1 hypothetical protein CA3LBN_003301 [[Candida] haemuloni]